MALPSVPNTSGTDSRSHAARQGLVVYGLLLLPLSLFGYWFYAVAQAGGLPLGTSLPIMLAPGVASLATRLLLHEGFADISLGLGTRRLTACAALLGVAVPLVVGTLAYGAAFGSGLVPFAPPHVPLLPASAGPVVNVAVIIALAATLGTLVLLPTAAGEELGWRGYVLPRLIEAAVPQPVLLSGLLWWAWHLIPVFTAGYAAGPSPPVSALMLLIAIPAFGCLLAWLRIDSGSIWPCVVAHAAWNAVINGGFDLAAHGETARYWTGESGVLTTVALLGVTLVIGYLRRRAAR